MSFVLVSPVECHVSRSIALLFNYQSSPSGASNASARCQQRLRQMPAAPPSGVSSAALGRRRQGCGRRPRNGAGESSLNLKCGRGHTRSHLHLHMHLHTRSHLHLHMHRHTPSHLHLTCTDTRRHTYTYRCMHRTNTRF